jgi:hypothetical protein
MNRILIFGGIVALIGGIILFLYKDNQRTKIELTKVQEIIKIKDIQIKAKDDIIETKKFQRELISKPDLSSDLNHRREWLQLLWEEDGNSNGSSP